MNPQPHPNRWRILIVLCMSLLITVVDGTIVNTALPTLARDLDAGSGDLQWIVDAYTLVFAGLLLLAGTLGDRFGRDRALSFGLGVFGVGSLMATFAASPAELIATRALMGAGAAFVMPATLSILSSVFTNASERAKAISLWAAVSGLGVAIGPSVGGLLLDHFAWGSVFAINIPLVIGTLVAIRRIVPRSDRIQDAPLDLVGAALSVAGLTALTWTLIEAPGYGWSRPPRSRRSPRRPRCSAGSAPGRCTRRTRWSTCRCSATRASAPRSARSRSCSSPCSVRSSC